MLFQKRSYKLSDKKQIITDKGVKDASYEQADFGKVADFVTDTWAKRRSCEARRTEEKIWKEIDRQIAMDPDIAFKTLSGKAGSEIDINKVWMPEIELPLQAQTLEVLTSDARRFMFPGDRPWFKAHAEVSDELLAKASSLPLIAGDTTGTTSQVNQDNIDKIVTGLMDFYQDQYTFQSNIDLINGEAFKYGTGVARTRPVMRRVLSKTIKGMNAISDKIIPVTFPISIKNTYLDDSKHILANEGFMLGNAIITEKPMAITDLKLAAHKGKQGSIDDMNGGWMPGQLSGLEGDKDNNVNVLEYEGDLLVEINENKTEFFPGAIVLVVIGKAGTGKDAKTLHRVVRFRRRGTKMSSFTEFHYHPEHIDKAYSTSPLKKGYPIQKCATEALSRLLQAAILNTEPPGFYDSNDAALAAQGGPVIFPGSMNATNDIDSVKFEQIGNPVALTNMFTAMVGLYSDVTGVNQPRLGQQTKSHTTAFSKNAELQQGVVRTVDYTETQLLESMTQILNVQYEIVKNNFKKETVYVNSYEAFVEVSKDLLPDNVKFSASGSNTPSEEKQTMQEKTTAIVTAVNLDPMKVQMGGKPMDIEKIQKQLLQTGGVLNAEEFFTATSNSQAGGVAQGQGVPGVADGTGNATPASIQNLQSIIGG